MKLKSGHTVEAVTGEEFDWVCKNFTPNKQGVIRLQPEGWFYHSSFAKYADRLYEFDFRPSDIIIMTYPKCGTTWMQEIVWTMRNNMSFDHPDAGISIMLRSPFIDTDFFFDVVPEGFSPENNFVQHFNKLCPGKKHTDGMFLQITDASQDPRTIKTHLPFGLLPPKVLDTCKVIFVARNAKDTCLSYYHHNRLLKAHGYQGTLEEFMDYFMKDQVMYSPYWTLMKEAWDRRHNPNLLFCYYEEMKENPKKNIERVNEFIGTDLNEEQIEKLVKYTSFKEMKERDVIFGMPGVVPPIMNTDVHEEEGGFFRKGVAGDWKSKFSKEEEDKMNEWIDENIAEFGPDFLYSKP